MNVDALTIDERTKLLKEGRCFGCKQTGHLARDCPNKKGKRDEPKKMNGKELHAYIRTLYREMDNKEQETFMKEAEESGF